MAAFVIPLIAAYGPAALTAAAGAAGAALAGLAVGRAINAYNAGDQTKKTQDKVLTVETPPAQITEAAANYIKAESELQESRVSEGERLLAARDIAEKYDYVAADEASGTLGLVADSKLAEGGDLVVTVENNTVTYTNDLISARSPYENFGTNDAPLAVSQEVPIEVSLPEDSAIPIISNREVIDSDVQLVAQTVITTDETIPIQDQIGDERLQASLDDNLQNTAVLTPPATPRIEQPVADSIIVGEEFDADTNKFLEDAARTSTATNLEEARRTETVAQQTANDANLIAAGANGGTPTNDSPPPPARPTNNAAASLPNYQTMEKPTTNVTVNNISKQVENTVEKPNPLHNYANYTYKLSLYAISKETANKITSGSGIQPGNEAAIISGGDLILSSGGSPSSSKGQLFNVDFYINNLNMTSVVGQTSRNRATDVIELSFDIFEPYNVTLLPRLIGTAQRLVGKPDWGLLFYVMKIDFIGYNDNGEPLLIPNTTKYVPFTMVNVEFDVTNRGAVYKVKGIPINHIAQTPLDNQIQFHMEISGGTVEDIFNGDTVAVTNSSNSSATQRGESAPAATQASTTKTFSKGIRNAMNENEKMFVANGKKKFADEYAFRFEDGIGSKKVYDPTAYRAQGFRMSDPSKVDEQIPSRIKLDKDKNTFRVQSGTRVTDLINTILQMSDYYVEQWSASPTPNKPLMMHKIIPEIEFGEFDDKTNMYKRKTTFVVIPYVQYGFDKDHFGQQPPPAAVKKYKWIFTGQSKDILDVKINYKMAFFELRNGADKAMIDEADGENSNLNGDRNGVEFADPTSIFPTKVKYVNSLPDQSNTGAKNRNIKTLNLEELFRRQFDPAGDLIKLDIQIVGDPDLIQQDNLLYGAKANRQQTVYSNGSINYASFEAYFNFEFKTPANDYSDSSGLFNLSSDSTNLFSGLYRIIQVKNEFRDGKFIQRLENYRVRKQSGTTTTNQRSTNTPAANVATAVTTNVPGAQSSPSNIITEAQRISGATTAVRSATDTGAATAVNPFGDIGTSLG